MSATVVVSEINNSGQVTQGISNLNLGSIDLVNLIPSPSNAIVAGQNSYRKYLMLTVTAMNSSSSLSEFRFYATPGVTFGTLVNSTGGSYTPLVFNGPTQTEVPNATPVLTSDGGYPIIGISGDLAATLTAPGNTDIFGVQLVTSPGTFGAMATQEFVFLWSES